MAAMEKNNKNLNVPNLRFPEFSGEWKKYLLKSITNIYDGTHQTPKYTKSGVPFMSVEDVTQKSSKEQKYISEQDFQNDFRNPPQKGDILMTRIGDIGTPCIVPTNEALGYYVSLALIRPLEKLQSCFLNYAIQSNSFKRELYKRTIHVAFPQKINKEDIGKCKLDVPSIEEQSRIGDLLSLIDERITTQKKIIEKYESLIRGLYQFLFQQAKYDHFVSLGDISQISNGNSDVKDASMYNDGSLYPFFDRSDEIKFLPEYLFDKEAIIYPGEGAEFYPRYYNGKFALHQRCYAVYDISTDFIPRYLYHYCKTQNSYFVRNAVGSTVASLRLDTFKRLKIPAIPTHHQESLVMFLDKIEAKIECNRTILKKYEEQKKYLLFTLFI